MTDNVVSAKTRYERMTECAGDCTNSNTTVQGTVLYMKFCDNSPCAVKTSKCVVDCSTNEMEPIGNSFYGYFIFK